MKILLILGVSGLILASTPGWMEGLGGRVERDSEGQIKAVNLRATWVSDGDLVELARLPKLQRLDLSRTRISDQGLAYLRSAPDLREVNLSYAEKIGDPAHAIVKHWKQLRRLNLRGTVIADETARSLAALPHLESLDIAETIVGDFGLEALTLAPELKELAIGNIRISELGYQSLRQFANLQHLDLSGGRHRGATTVTEQGVQAIASLQDLRVLKLGHVRFPPKSMPALKDLSNLEELGLEFSPDVGDDVIPHLVSWQSLRLVDLHGTKVSADGIAELRKQRPDCKFLWE
jgi:internalin A